MRESRRKQKKGYEGKIRASHKIVWTLIKNKYDLPDYKPNLVSNG